MASPIPLVTPSPGERLRAARERAGLTRPALASASGITTTTIYRAETDRRGLGAETLRKLADEIAKASRRPVGEVLEELTRNDG